MLSDRDRKFLEVLRARLPEAAGSLQRIVVTLDDRPSEAVALYVNDDWDLIGVGGLAVSYSQEFSRFDPADPSTPSLIRRLTGEFGALAFAICTVCDPPRALGMAGCPH